MWSQLHLTVLYAEFRAQQSCRLPRYKGSTLRGALGHALKQLACHRQLEPCEGCRNRDGCAYGGLFEPPVDRDGEGPNFDRPLPYILSVPLDSREQFAAGDRLEMGLTLVGRGRQWLPWVVSALDCLGRQGLGWGRGPWTLTNLWAEGPVGRRTPLSPDLEHCPALDGETLTIQLPSDSTLLLRLLTPTWLQQRGRPASEISGELLMRRLLRRLGELVERYCDGSVQGFDFAGLLEAAGQMHCRGVNVRPYRFERYSNRQQRRHELAGLVGDVHLSHIAPQLLPYLVLGQWIHVGKSAGFGMGQYCLLPVG